MIWATMIAGDAASNGFLWPVMVRQAFHEASAGQDDDTLDNMTIAGISGAFQIDASVLRPGLRHRPLARKPWDTVTSVAPGSVPPYPFYQSEAPGPAPEPDYPWGCPPYRCGATHTAKKSFRGSCSNSMRHKFQRARNKQLTRTERNVLRWIHSEFEKALDKASEHCHPEWCECEHEEHNVGVSVTYGNRGGKCVVGLIIVIRGHCK